MAEPFLLVTGFGPFLNVPHNASGALAQALDGRAAVRGVQLPTEYEGAGARLEELVAEGHGHGLAGILSMGVHKGPNFRLEARSGSAPPSEKPDAAGRVWDQGPRVVAATTVDLDACLAAMGAVCGGRVAVSEDAGGYVCDFVCGWILKRGQELSIPSLFLHIPKEEHMPLSEQEPAVLALVNELWRQLGLAK